MEHLCSVTMTTVIKSRSRAIMAEALRESYEGIFHVSERPTDSDRSSIEGKFKSEHNVSDQVARRQAMTFLALIKLADLDADEPPASTEDMPDEHQQPAVGGTSPQEQAPKGTPDINLRCNVEVHLPATKDIEVYNAIFKSLREHLLDD